MARRESEYLGRRQRHHTLSASLAVHERFTNGNRPGPSDAPAEPPKGETMSGELIVCPFCKEQRIINRRFYGIGGHQFCGSAKDSAANRWIFIVCPDAKPQPRRGWWQMETGHLCAEWRGGPVGEITL